MSKDYAKFSATQIEAKSRIKRKLIFIIALIILLMICTGIIFYLQKENKIHLPLEVVEENIKKISSFLGTKKQDKIAMNKAASDMDADSEIHFEFYDILPKASFADNDVKNEVVKTDIAKIAQKNTVEPDKKILVEEKKINSGIKAMDIAQAKPKSIFSVEKLSRMLEEEKQSPQFTLKMGEFGTKFAADEFVKAIKSVGLQAKAVRLSSTVYSVQTGPFHSKDEAQLNQSLFQKRGIIAKIEKS